MNFGNYPREKFGKITRNIHSSAFEVSTRFSAGTAKIATGNKEACPVKMFKPDNEANPVEETLNKYESKYI